EAAASALDELVVAGDAAVLVEDEDLQAGARRLAAAGGDHVPVELDDVAEAVCVAPRLEGELSGCAELLVGAGHLHLERIVPAGFEDGGGEAQLRRGLADLLRWLEDVGAVLGPQVADGLAALLRVGLVPDRHVAADELSRFGAGHGFSMVAGVGGVAPAMLRAGAAAPQFPAGNGRHDPDPVDTAV